MSGAKETGVPEQPVSAGSLSFSAGSEHATPCTCEGGPDEYGHLPSCDAPSGRHGHAANMSSTDCPECMKEGEAFIQRARRGFADSDVWSLDTYLARVLASALPELAKLNNGCPPGLCQDGDVEKGCERWHSILAEMADGFAEFAVEHDVSRPKIKRSLELLCEWFGDLWD